CATGGARLPHRSARAKPFRCHLLGTSQGGPRRERPTHQIMRCVKNYSVSITLMCLFYHTVPLALSMTWEVGKGIKSDYRSLKHPRKPRHFRFLCACRWPKLPLNVRTYLPCSTWNTVRTMIAHKNLAATTEIPSDAKPVAIPI